MYLNDLPHRKRITTFLNRRHFLPSAFFHSHSCGVNEIGRGGALAQIIFGSFRPGSVSVGATNQQNGRRASQMSLPCRSVQGQSERSKKFSQTFLPRTDRKSTRLNSSHRC